MFLGRLHHDQPVHRQYGSVQRTSRCNRSLKDDDEALAALEDASIPRERIIAVDREEVDEALDVTELSESAVYESEYVRKADIAAVINSIAEPALTDATHGNLGELDVTFPPLDAAREPTTEPNIHIAAFDTAASPGSPDYVAPDAGKGEAGIITTYIANGLADGTLGDADTDSDGNGDGDGDVDDGQPDLTVLFRWRTQMARYADVFEAEGLSVANASDYLFECRSSRRSSTSPSGWSIRRTQNVFRRLSPTLRSGLPGWQTPSMTGISVSMRSARTRPRSSTSATSNATCSSGCVMLSESNSRF